jgi:hypothetical protein
VFDVSSCFSFLPSIQLQIRKKTLKTRQEPSIFTSDLIKLLEKSILTFRLFLKEKKKNSASAHGQTGSSIQQVQSSLDKVCLDDNKTY